MPHIVLKEHDSEKSLEALESPATIGRDPTCAFLIEGPNSKVVSARHARIVFEEDAWWIEDSSRNGTIVDDERLQQGQRHPLKVGQVIGLGESGPRYKVVTLDSRKVSDTVLEPPGAGVPIANATTAPRQPAAARPAPSPARSPEIRTAPLRQSEAVRAGLKFEEPTEPMAPSPDWLVHIILRATNTNQHYELRSDIIRLGRSPECNVQIPPEQGASVSRVHAEILIHDGGVMLRDAGSRNGTFLNGRRVDAPHPTIRNDLIMLGSGGPTFSIEDLHIVKGPTKPKGEAGSGGAPVGNGGVSTPKNARPALGMASSPASPLSRHTSYRAEAPTAPSKGGRAGPGLTRKVLDEVSSGNSGRTRVYMWAGLAAILAATAILLLRGR